ncbi:MAG: type II toxin-antitoxin system mRNA interferase toxin, RelE/StbE family [Rhodoferax sp.]|nr:type II toxin-antitoxin system mRNA interferase toxin, RelE/StbE family [Rhodoferax sp.]
MRWQVVFTKHALKDAKKSAAAGLKGKAQDLLRILSVDPFQNSSPFEKWVGDLEGTYSQRVNIPQRLVDEVFEKEPIVRVLRTGTGYE